MSNRLLNQVGIEHLSAQLYVYNIGMSNVVLKVHSNHMGLSTELLKFVFMYLRFDVYTSK